MPRAASSVVTRSATAVPVIPLARGPNPTLPAAREVGEQEVVGEEEPGAAGCRVEGVLWAGPGPAADLHVPLLQRQQAGEGVEDGGLAGAVRTEDREHLTGRGSEGDVDAERAPGGDDVRVEAFRSSGCPRHQRTHRPRSAPSTTTDTVSMTTLSAIAASGSCSKAV